MPTGSRQTRQGRSLPRFAAVFAIAAGLAALVAASTRSGSGYQDDTHHSLRSVGKVVELRGDQGMGRIDFRRSSDGSVGLDARAAVFTVANSRNPNPTAEQDCNRGSLPTNSYPLRILGQDRTVVAGGLFLSRVPQSAEWRASYCNSAAVFFRDAPNGIVDGVRITGAWDAVRASRQSPNLLITNSWISAVKDDAFENDYLQPATIRDTLIDGAFEGISVKPGRDSTIGDASASVVTLSGVLLRLPEFPYRGRMLFGSLAKSEKRSPRLSIRNSVIAVDHAGGGTYDHYWASGWSKLADSSNNLFLWLSDAPVPASLPLPPAGFRILKGQAARDAWAKARRNWIDCHPKLARLPSDPRSNPASCTPGTWGGFTH